MKVGKTRVAQLHALGLGFGLATLLLAPRHASALEPLSDFVRSAKERNFDAREQAAVAGQRDGEASQAWWKLAPTVTGTGTYTHNQYPAIATIPIGNPTLGQTESVTIMAQNQLDAVFTASLPIVDVGSWERIGAARRTAIAAKAQVHATDHDVQRAVAQAYYQFVANEAVLRSANGRRDTAKANLDFVRTRNAAGVSQDLDLKRATAELECGPAVSRTLSQRPYCRKPRCWRRCASSAVADGGPRERTGLRYRAFRPIGRRSTEGQLLRACLATSVASSMLPSQGADAIQLASALHVLRGAAAAGIEGRLACDDRALEPAAGMEDLTLAW
jgi:hypothetical protein